jgi:hypothetical protein
MIRPMHCTPRLALLTALLIGAPLLTGCGAAVYAEASTPQVAVDADVDARAQVQAQQPAAEVDYQDTDPAALTDFQEPLSPYGTWVQDGNYGTVWVPNSETVGPDFAPYQTAGHWALDDGEDWVWVSDYEWGYVPFHYGRWIWVGGRGWCWIPGRRYAPAWVSWRVGEGGYIGWAPMPPSYYWADGYAVGMWVVPPAPFIFCRTEYVFYDHVSTYVVRDQASVQGAASSTRPYHPGQAHVGQPGGKPDGASAHSGVHAIGRGPAMGDAHVRPEAAPHVRVDPRSVALASRAGTVAVRQNGFASVVRPQSPHQPFGAPAAQNGGREAGRDVGMTGHAGRPTSTIRLPNNGVVDREPVARPVDRGVVRAPTDRGVSQGSPTVVHGRDVPVVHTPAFDGNRNVSRGPAYSPPPVSRPSSPPVSVSRPSPPPAVHTTPRVNVPAPSHSPPPAGRSGGGRHK